MKASQVIDYVERATELLLLGQTEEANRCIEQALIEHPENSRLSVLRGRILEQAGRNAMAWEHYLQMSARAPENPYPDLRLVHLALKRGDLEAAEHHATIAAQRGLDQGRLHLLRARIAQSRKDELAQTTELEAVLRLDGEPKPGVLMRLAALRSRSGDRAGALVLLERIVSRDHDNIGAHLLLGRVAALLGDADRAEEAYAVLARLDPDNPKWIADRSRMLDMMGRREEAGALVRDAIERGLVGCDLLKQGRGAVLSADLMDHALQWAESVGADAPMHDRDVAMEVLLANGRAVPPHLADCAMEPGADGGNKLSRLDWLAHAPSDDSLKREIVSSFGGEELRAARSTTSTTVAVIFTGLVDRAMVPLPSLDRYFAELDISTIYLRDSTRFLFNSGISSISSDFSGTVDYLRRLLADWNTCRLVSVGSSAGGFAAIRYGLALGAERIVTFSSPTNLNSDFLAEDGRARLVEKRLQGLPREVLDIRPTVRANRGRTPIHVTFGKGMRQDSRHAHHIAGEPGVHLHPIEGLAVHDSLVWLAREGRLMSFLGDTLL